MSQWWRKNGVHHHLMGRIATRHLNAPNSNDLQEHVFSVYEHINNTFQQNMGNAKFEMLLILSFNKAFIKDMESKNLFTINNLIASLRSTADVTEATANIIKYFDLDDDVEDDKMDERLEIIVMLKSADAPPSSLLDSNVSPN